MEPMIAVGDIYTGEINGWAIAKTVVKSPMSPYIPPDDDFHEVTVTTTKNTVTLSVDEEILGCWLNDDPSCQELAVYVLHDALGLPME